MRQKLLAIALLLWLAGYMRPALAHEPLWGETPQTFAFGVIHPEVRFARGSTRLGLQYAFSTTRNVRVEVPVESGDPILSVKGRVHARFGPDFKQMGALIVGATRGGRQLGYAFAHERLIDTIWASAVHTAGTTELDVAYGYWTKRARTPTDTGVLIALGLHQEKALRGVHGSFIVTKGQTQTRVGVLYPTKGRAQVRFGLEALL
jgi:hypothetical protein